MTARLVNGGLERGGRACGHLVGVRTHTICCREHVSTMHGVRETSTRTDDAALLKPSPTIVIFAPPSSPADLGQ